jgi:coenzyme F420-0:L-glutamate ligase/coenzyme F420-1:gamma-L-glutamate ligase
MSSNELKILAVPGIPEISSELDLGEIIAQSTRKANLEIDNGDIFVVAQKIVSKAEGQVVSLDTIEPSSTALRWAEFYDKDARIIEVVLKESKRLVRMERGLIISETAHGFICANAGVDASNTVPNQVSLLPKDPDESATRILRALEKEFAVKLAVIVSDTFGRPWREGQVNVALGVAGIAPLLDYRGKFDSFGRELEATIIAISDELASAAELLTGKTTQMPVVVIKGFEYSSEEDTSQQIVRPPEKDLFR